MQAVFPRGSLAYAADRVFGLAGMRGVPAASVSTPARLPRGI